MMDVWDRFSIFSTSATSVKHVILKVLEHQVLSCILLLKSSSICVSPQKPALVFDPWEEEEFHLLSPRCFWSIGGKGDETPRPLGFSFLGTLSVGQVRLFQGPETELWPLNGHMSSLFPPVNTVLSLYFVITGVPATRSLLWNLLTYWLLRTSVLLFQATSRLPSLAWVQGLLSASPLSH